MISKSGDKSSVSCSRLGYKIRREDNERVNNTAACDKQYLEGGYGADPYLKNMLTGGEWQ